MRRMSQPIVRVFDTPQAVAHAAAVKLLDLGREALDRRGVFRVALAGGSTPRLMYGELAQRPEALDWSRVELFFGDERTVPPDHPDSNYRLAFEHLLQHLPIQPDRVHRIPAERSDPHAAAAEYGTTLRRLFGPAHPWPVFDLVLLGMGPDGHTASLFPGSSALDETSRWVAATWVPRLQTWRITLTFPAINAARQVLFAVTGADKAGRLAQVLGLESGGNDLPAARIRTSGGGVIWLIDQAASGGRFF